MKRSVLGILGALALIAASTAGANTLYVPQNYPTIQRAVNAAQPGDLIQVAAGTYHDTTNTAPGDTTKCVVVLNHKTGITIQGAGAATTIIDAYRTHHNGSRGIMSRASTNIQIRGFTIRNAFAGVYGAGIFADSASTMTLTSCTITANLDGGIIFLNGSGGLIGSCTVSNNHSKQGGGIALEAGCSPRIQDCTISGNAAPVAGGLYIRTNSNATVTNCVIRDNYLDVTSTGSGGGVQVTGSAPTFTGCQILNNTATGSGGGVAITESSVVTMTGCLIQGNQTTASDYGPGGGVYVDFSSLTIQHSIIARNAVYGTNAPGAGLYASFCDPRVGYNVNLVQCTFATNENHGIPQSGTITSSLSSPVIDKCIIAYNNPGQAIACLDYPEAEPNNTCAEAQYMGCGDAIGPGNLVAGEQDWYAFDVYSTSNRLTIGTEPVYAGDNTDTYLELWETSGGSCTNIVAQDNDNGPGAYSLISNYLPTHTGTYKVKVRGNTGGASGRYRLFVYCGDPQNPALEPPTVSCTDIYGNSAGNAICGHDGGHNFSLDPLFCDMAHDNYRIASNSPCYPGRHPEGVWACGNLLIGGGDPGCNPADVSQGDALPSGTRLIGNEPNPFHPATTIRYEIARAGTVDLRIYDVAGREVRVLAEGLRAPGRYQARWDGRTAAGAPAPSGVYFYRLSLNGVAETRRMVLTR